MRFFHPSLLKIRIGLRREGVKKGHAEERLFCRLDGCPSRYHVFPGEMGGVGLLIFIFSSHQQARPSGQACLRKPANSPHR